LDVYHALIINLVRIAVMDIIKTAVIVLLAPLSYLIVNNAQILRSAKHAKMDIIKIIQDVLIVTLILLIALSVHLKFVAIVYLDSF
jgi:hypothetical protein